MTRKVRTCYEHSIVTPPLLLRPRSERVRRWSGGQRGILLTSPRHASTRLSQRFDRRVRWQRCDSQTVLSFRFAYILNFPVLKFSAWCWKSWATRLITTHALNLPHISLGYLLVPAIRVHTGTGMFPCKLHEEPDPCAFRMGNKWHHAPSLFTRFGCAETTDQDTVPTALAHREQHLSLPALPCPGAQNN